MIQIALDVLQTAVALLLALNCFLRLTKTNADTFREIRHSFALLFALSLAVAAAPWVAGRHADQLGLLVLCNVLLLQASTTRHWRYQVPHAFQKSAYPI